MKDSLSVKSEAYGVHIDLLRSDEWANDFADLQGELLEKTRLVVGVVFEWGKGACRFRGNACGRTSGFWFAFAKTPSQRLTMPTEITHQSIDDSALLLFDVLVVSVSSGGHAERQRAVDDVGVVSDPADTVMTTLGSTALVAW